MTDQPTLVKRGVKGTKISKRPEAVGKPINPGHRHLTPAQVKLQARLRARLPKILQESVEARKIYPDPVQALVDLLGSMPGDSDTWEEIIF